MSKRKIILDCDPGHDDAIALLLSCYSDKLDLLAVTTAAGNQTIEKTSKNALNLLNFFNKHVPLAKGSSSPIRRKILTCPEIHGESGLDGFTFPVYEEIYDKRVGYQLIIDTLLENDKVTVIVTGPMTNLALAINHNPNIISHIEEIVLMGGSTGEGNITKAAEFNILVDPEAADICFKAGVPMRMLGLNVIRQILVTPEVVKEAEKIHTRGNENAFVFEDMNVTIDTSDTDQAGKTICSYKEPHNCRVATKVNLNEYWKEIYEHLRRCN